MKKLLLIILLLSSSLYAQSSCEQEIREVLNRFRKAMVDKDSAEFNKLFLHDSIPWIGIHIGKSAEFAIEKYKGFNGKTEYSYARCIEGIVNANYSSDEIYDQIHIHCDQGIASLSLRYRFLMDGKINNWGHENFLLFHHEGVWRIMSVNYSVNLQEVTPFKE